MAEGFLGRWSQRKQAARKGQELAEEPTRELAPGVPPPQPSPGGGGSQTGSSARPLAEGQTDSSARSLAEGQAASSPPPVADGRTPASPPPLGEGQGGGAPAVQPAPTLADAQALTKDSDFRRFIQPGVAPEVKNTAMKKLFSDPHFNTMDGLDTYIGDYNKADPIPPEMLRKLASAKFLKLFEEKEEEEEDTVAEDGVGKSPTGSASPDAGAPESVAQSSTRTAQALPPAPDHADPDLRLQQDDAPGPESPGAGSR